MRAQSKTPAVSLDLGFPQNRFYAGFKYSLYRRAIIETVMKLNPGRQRLNPVMFVLTLLGVLAGALFLWVLLARRTDWIGSAGAIVVCLWGTVLLTNFAEALTEGGVQVRAEAVRRLQKKNRAKKLSEPNSKNPNYELIPATSLKQGDVVLVEATDIIPADGEVIEGSAQIDESILTGVGPALTHEVNNDCNAVSGGARVLSGSLVIRVKAIAGEGLLDQMIDLVEKAKHRLPGYEQSLNVLLVYLAIITLFLFLLRLLDVGDGSAMLSQEIPVFLIFLVTLLATFVPIVSGGRLLNLIDLAGLNYLVRHNVIALSNQAVQAAEMVEVLFLEKDDILSAAPRTGEVQGKMTISLGIKEQLARLRLRGIRAILITNDESETAVAIAAEVGADDFLAQATATTKLRLLNRYRANGRPVAVTGHKLEDVTLMSEADLAVATQPSTRLARDMAGMINLDNEPNRLLEIVAMGKQRLLTRQALTVFGLAFDITRLFIVLTATFGVVFPALNLLTFLSMGPPVNVVLAALAFNTLSVVILLSLILLREGTFPLPGSDRLRGLTVLTCGLAGIVTPFVGIKVIGLILAGLGLV